MDAKGGERLTAQVEKTQSYITIRNFIDIY